MEQIQNKGAIMGWYPGTADKESGQSGQNSVWRFFHAAKEADCHIP